MLIWCAPVTENGLTTAETWGSPRSEAVSLAVARRLAALVTGPVVERTICAGLPAWAGSLAARMLCTWADSELPEVKLLEKSVPSTWAMTLIEMSAPSHTRRTNQRWS